MSEDNQNQNTYINKAISSAFLLRICGLGLAFLSQILLARIFPKAELGSYFFLMSISTLIIAFSTLGMNKAALKFVPTKSSDPKGNLHYVISYFSKVILISATSVALLAVLLLRLYSKNDIASLTIAGASIFLIICIIGALSEYYSGILLGYKKTVLSLLTTQVVKPVLMLCGIAVIWVFGFSTEFITVLAVNAIAAIGVFILIRFFYHKLGSAKGSSTFESSGEKKELLVLGLGFQGIVLCNIFLTQTDSIMIGIMLTSEDVASYAVALKVAGLLTFFLNASNMVAAPLISKYYAESRIEQLRVLVRYISRLVIFVTGFFAFAVILFSEKILGLFGSTYTDAATLLQILCVGTFFNSMTGPASYLLSLTGHQREVLLVLAGSAILNIILNYVLIAYMGLLGAAVATCIVTIFWNLALFFIVRNRIGITTFI